MKSRFALLTAACLFFCSTCFGTDVTDDTLKGNANSKFLAFPFFLKSPETYWGFGAVAVYFFKAKKNDLKIRTSDVNLVTLYTLRKQVVSVLGATIYFPEEKKIIRFQSSYSYYPDKFWGMGNHSRDESIEEYSMRQFFFNPQLLGKFFRNWYAGFSYEFQNVYDFDYVSNGIFDREDITGRHGGNVSGVGMLLTWDTRNHAYSPSKGLFAELNATAYDKRLGSDYNFTSFTLDFRKFVSVSRKSVLAFQGVIKNNAGIVPFRNFSMLGGPEMMRGYYKGRFAATDLLAIQSELRYHLFWRLGLVVFAGAGEVSNHFSEIAFANLHYSGGGGVRLMVSKSEKLNLRLDYGIGKNSSGLYVILKEAF